MIFKNLVDTHTHTINSFDGNYPIEDMCDSAIEKSLKTVAFTDHVEMDFFYEKGYDKDAAASYADALRAIEIYKDRLEILKGVEMGEPTYNEQLSLELMNSRDYDFVIGSIHNLRDMPDFAELDYNTLSPEYISQLLDTYFNELKLMASWARFDTLAHITYPLRYIAGEYKIPVDMSKYKSDVDEILSLLIENDRAMEINTSGLRQKLGLTMPDESIVRRYHELGGKLITVGSDSHFTEHMGAGIREGMEIAKRCGFDSVQVFRKRIPCEIPIE